MTIEAVMLWNEPNNLSHWDVRLDAGFQIFADMVKCAATEIGRERPKLLRVLGGISPIDPTFIRNMGTKGVLDVVDAVAVHGFPLDDRDWQVQQWPDKIDSIRRVTDKPVWVSEVGVSTLGADDVQEFGLRRCAEHLSGRAPRIHWSSLYDLPRAWSETLPDGEASSAESISACYFSTRIEVERTSRIRGIREVHMGLLDEDGFPKRALGVFADLVPEFGLCQWFEFEDPRLEDAVRWMKLLGVKYVRTGLSWADSFRPHADAWFDRQMRALDDFEVTVTFSETPSARGIRNSSTSPPRSIAEFAAFCTRMVRRYA